MPEKICRKKIVLEEYLCFNNKSKIWFLRKTKNATNFTLKNNNGSTVTYQASRFHLLQEQGAIKKPRAPLNASEQKEREWCKNVETISFRREEFPTYCSIWHPDSVMQRCSNAPRGKCGFPNGMLLLPSSSSLFSSLAWTDRAASGGGVGMWVAQINRRRTRRQRLAPFVSLLSLWLCDSTGCAAGKEFVEKCSQWKTLNHIPVRG